MHKIKVLNNISAKGLDKFSSERFELGEAIEAPQGILVRSSQLTSADIGKELLAVGRAGAGVNNIPVDEMTNKGIVVFNTPGANANAVKELVMTGLLLSQRGIIEGIDYVNSLAGFGDGGRESNKAALNNLIEANKKKYKGSELKGKTLGVLGLGAIGSMVAEMALQMGMRVLGYDPALSVEAAWRLPSQVKKMDNMQSLFSNSDIVTLHVPALESTLNLINQESLSCFRQGAVLLNFSRAQIVNETDIGLALNEDRISQYISDFPSPTLIGKPGVISTPHLGASTMEAEENCAMMVVDQMIDFLENGNIHNAVNFPRVSLERTDGYRVTFANKNVPRILGNVLSILADKNINVIDMLNKSVGDIAYNIIDIEAKPTIDLEAEILKIDGVINVRLIV